MPSCALGTPRAPKHGGHACTQPVYAHMASSTGTLISTQPKTMLRSGIPLPPILTSSLCSHAQMCLCRRQFNSHCSNFAGCSHHFPGREGSREQGQENTRLLSPSPRCATGAKLPTAPGIFVWAPKAALSSDSSRNSGTAQAHTPCPTAPSLHQFLSAPLTCTSWWICSLQGAATATGTWGWCLTPQSWAPHQVLQGL